MRGQGADNCREFGAGCLLLLTKPGPDGKRPGLARRSGSLGNVGIKLTGNRFATFQPTFTHLFVRGFAFALQLLESRTLLGS